MALDTKANDWEVATVTALSGGGAGINIGGWLFVFRSKTAVAKEAVIFGGYGLGAGLRYKGADVKGAGTVSILPNSFADIPCTRQFSLHDLDCAGGRVTEATASFMGGYGLTIITAFDLDYPMFESVNLWGVTSGVALSMSTNAGFWKVLELHRSEYPEVAAFYRSNVNVLAA